MESKQAANPRSLLPSKARPVNSVEEYVARLNRGGSRYRRPDSAVSKDSPPIDQGVAMKRKDASYETEADVQPMNADQQTKFARQVGASRPRQLVRDSAIQSHPSRGGSRGFPVSERLTLTDMWAKGLPVPKSRVRSIQRWIKEGVLPLR